MIAGNLLTMGGCYVIDETHGYDSVWRVFLGGGMCIAETAEYPSLYKDLRNDVAPPSNEWCRISRRRRMTTSVFRIVCDVWRRPMKRLSTIPRP